MTARTTTSRTLVAAVAAAVVLAGCSSGGRPATSATPTARPAAPAPVAAGPGGIANAEGPYPVVALLDAETVQLDRGANGGLTTVRLLGAVAPDTTEPAACYGPEATSEAHRLLDGAQVRIVADPGSARLDPAGLPLVYVWLDSGRMLNDVLVEGGFAREATGAAPYLYRFNLARSEQLARSAGRGLWSPQTCSGNIARAPRP